jgi:hypothetical protein
MNKGKPADPIKYLHDIAPFVLSILLTIGFFSVLFFLLMYGVPANGGEALLVMLGSLGTSWTMAVSHFFVSSSGSKHKTDLLAKKKQGSID